jgi:hypothetical protein
MRVYDPKTIKNLPEEEIQGYGAEMLWATNTEGKRECRGWKGFVTVGVVGRPITEEQVKKWNRSRNWKDKEAWFKKYADDMAFFERKFPGGFRQFYNYIKSRGYKINEIELLKFDLEDK